jgi:UrcA family protein
MPRTMISAIRIFSGVAAAGALGFALSATPAFAQNYGSYYGSDTETVEVYGHRYPTMTPRGGVLMQASLSADVSSEGLDLRTSRGAHRFRARILAQARELCDQLDARYPVTANESPPCFRTAVERGMEDADAAIDHARSYAER